MAKFTLQPPGPKPPPPTEPDIDPAALTAFAAGARERRGAEDDTPPWERFDPQAKPRHSVSLRLNDYHMTMLHYVAEHLDRSQHKILSKQLLPALEQIALDMFNSHRSKSD